MDFVHPVEAVIPGAQGRILAVLVETTAELNLRTLARLAGVSAAQASRLLPRLVELGLVERREVQPSSLFRLVRTNIAAMAIVDLAQSRNVAFKGIGERAAAMAIPPESIVVFGSFARGMGGCDSDLDVVVVRSDDVAEDDDEWATSLERWRNEARLIVGNPVEVIEVSRTEAQLRLVGSSQLWLDVLRDGVAVHGPGPHELIESVDA